MEAERGNKLWPSTPKDGDVEAPYTVHMDPGVGLAFRNIWSEQRRQDLCGVSCPHPDPQSFKSNLPA